MRTYMDKTDFFLRIKRKPAQEELLQKVRAGELTEQQIEECGQPLWVREALTNILLRGGQSSNEAVMEEVARREAIQAANARQTYPQYEWIGPTMELKPKRGFSYEVQPGEYVLADVGRGQIKIDYTLIIADTDLFAAIAPHLKYREDVTDPGHVNSVGLRKQGS